MTVLIAHRCNSGESIEAAVAAGARWVEIDAASDGSGGLVARHDAGSVGPPLLGLLELAAQAGVRVTVDLKCGQGEVADVCTAVGEAGLEGRALLSGSYGRPWAEMRSLLPGALLGWSPPEPGRWQLLFARRAIQQDFASSAPELLDSIGVDVLLPHHSLVSAGLVAAVGRQQREIHAWTVNSTRQARRLAQLGVDAVVTDRPREVAAGIDSN